MERLVQLYGPSLPLGQLVVEVNQLYHAVEARQYDRTHPELTEQLPPIWSEMVGRVATLRPEPWSVLDIGCGTGFEAAQLLRGVAPSAVTRLVCYDPSAEMLRICQKRIRILFPSAEFVSEIAAIGECDAPFNMLMTNSLLHHLPEPFALVESLLPILSSDAVWISGHEPSARFFANDHCRAAHERYLRDYRWRRLLMADNYLTKVKLYLHLQSDPAREAAKEATDIGLFERRPPAWLISRLTDFNVPHAVEDIAVGRGLDIKVMATQMTSQWELRWMKTYAFMGSFLESRLPSRWSKIAADLQMRFPDDGANFSAVWQRVETT